MYSEVLTYVVVYDARRLLINEIRECFPDMSLGD